MDGKNTQRKPMVPGKSSRVDAEVARLLSKPVVDKQEFMRLRSKMDDAELVEQIQLAYMEAFEKIEKRAKAFAQKILERHGITNQPFSQLLAKATKYADKYELSTAEKIAFTRILEQELVGAQRSDVPKVTTNMSKVLGDITIDTKGFGMKVNDADYRDLQDILQLREETKPLHSQVILQSLAYQSCSEVAVNGRFSPENGHNLACHVHPVIVALFLHKIDILEQHFLYSNLANIVASRYNKEAFRTRPDYELFYNLVTDPNDIVCDSRSPIKDLKNRVHLQKQLWQSVLGLRNGQYYECDQLDLMRAIDMCRLNKYDTPDSVYGRYDGTIIKRLFAAFSFHPTLVFSVPTSNIASNSMNPYFQTANPVVSKISMLNLRLPQFSRQYLTSGIPTPGALTSNVHVRSDKIKLEDALQQSQILFENGSLVMKNTQVIDTREILTFFVDRRHHNLNLSHYSDPIKMIALPSALSGFERVNTSPIEVSTSISLSDNISTQKSSAKNVNLISVVCAKTTSVGDDKSNQNLLIGSEAIVVNHDESGKTVFRYDPMGATSYHMPKGAKQPMTVLGDTEVLTLQDTDGNSLVASKGVLFVFRLQSKSA